MKNTIAILSLLLLLTLSACKKDPATVGLKFKPMFGSAAYQSGTTYHGSDGSYYKFNEFVMFISHIKLVRTDNTTVELSPLIYFDGDVLQSQSLPATTVPAGEYKGLQFGVGLDSAQSATNPGSFADGSDPNPLNPYLHDTYWQSMSAYVYIKVDGFFGSTSTPQNSFVFHVGTNPYYKTVSINKSFVVSEGSQTSLEVTSDLQKLFYGITSPIDINTENRTQTSDNTTLAHKFMDSFVQTFSIQ